MDDVAIEGTVLPKGAKVLGMIISANRDENIFERPDALDPTRDPNRHLTFAFGKHFCLGNQFARMEGQIAIGELNRRFPHMRLAVPRDALGYKPVQALRGFRSLPSHPQLVPTPGPRPPAVDRGPRPPRSRSRISSRHPLVRPDRSPTMDDAPSLSAREIARLSTEEIFELAAETSQRMASLAGLV